jgi:phosphoadenosine phosphosulfate reductase
MDQTIGIYPVDPAAANRSLVPLSAQERVRWAVDHLGLQAVVLSSMQKSSSVLLHILASVAPDNQILFVDTGYHFPETLAVRDEFTRRFGSRIITLYPELSPIEQKAKYGYDLYDYVDGQPDCCQQRKEVPFLNHVRAQGIQLVMLGLRRAEGGARGSLQPLELDPRYSGYVLHPLLDWSAEDLDNYIELHDVPVNALHARSFPSIGCSVCTTPVAPGEDERAGRWRHLRGEGVQPQYCGLNFSDGGGI